MQMRKMNAPRNEQGGRSGSLKILQGRMKIRKEEKKKKKKRKCLSMMQSTPADD